MRSPGKNSSGSLASASVAGVGWYLGWYSVRSTPAPDGQRSVTVDFNTTKIGEDLRDGAHKIQQKLAEKSQAKQKTEAPKEAPKVIADGWITLPELPVVEEQRSTGFTTLPALPRGDE